MLEFYNAKLGSFQFKFNPNKEKYKSDGFVFVEAANIIQGTEKCDWSNKVLFKLGISDLSTISYNLMTQLYDFNIIHKIQTKTSFLTFKTGTNNTVGINLKNDIDGKSLQANIYLKPQEIYALELFLRTALTKIVIEEGI